MTLRGALISVWRQALVEEKKTIELAGESYPVKATRRRGLRTVEFSYAGQRLDAIEQNPQTTSRWAQLARRGQRVMQFTCQGRYIANVAEGKLTRYAPWHDLRLDE
ncbi:MAG: hypothetical protein ACRD35_06710 [Candidatus Acidiferrales bacterium]